MVPVKGKQRELLRQPHTLQVEGCHFGHCPSTGMPAMATCLPGTGSGPNRCSAGGEPKGLKASEGRKCTGRVKMRDNLSISPQILSYPQGIKKDILKKCIYSLILFKHSISWRWTSKQCASALSAPNLSFLGSLQSAQRL